MESLFELWGKRNPEWEVRYQSTIIDVFADYGKGVNQYQEIKGKIFGAGYEVYIIAFFIGLYFDQAKPLIEDKSKRKVLGQPIMYWGNVENRQGRNSYGKIREYIFAALIAKTNVDLIALDKGDITPRSVVDALISKMEQYANFGFDYIEEQLCNDPNYFFKESAFLRVFTSFLTQKNDNIDVPDDIPDSLDVDNPTDIHPESEIDAAEEVELEKKCENETWSENEVELMTLLFQNGADADYIAQRLRRALYSVKYKLSQMGLIKVPLTVVVENTSFGCCLKNKVGEIVYEDDSKLKIFHDAVYRFNLKSMCLTVKSLTKSEGVWTKNDKLLVAYKGSKLFSAISNDFINDIEDFVEGNTFQDSKIKMNGVWYDCNGDEI